LQNADSLFLLFNITGEYLNTSALSCSINGKVASIAPDSSTGFVCSRALSNLNDPAGLVQFSVSGVEDAAGQNAPARTSTDDGTYVQFCKSLHTEMQIQAMERERERSKQRN
jgi:hypothetical protein